MLLPENQQTFTRKEAALWLAVADRQKSFSQNRADRLISKPDYKEHDFALLVDLADRYHDLLEKTLPENNLTRESIANWCRQRNYSTEPFVEDSVERKEKGIQRPRRRPADILA